MFRDSSDDWEQAPSEPDAEQNTGIHEPEMLTDARSEAKRRVEMAKYYTAIIDSGVFGEDISDAGRIVDEEMREYANERMEILLGMRSQTKAVPVPVPVQVELPFTDSEIKALKALAASAMKRFSDDSPTPVVRPVTVSTQETVKPKMEPNPVVRPAKGAAKPKMEQLSSKTKAKTTNKSKKIGGRPADALPVLTGAALTAAMTQKADEQLTVTSNNVNDVLVTSAMLAK